MEDFNSKYTGEQVEQLLDQVANGGSGGGGGGIAVETDPVFSASPAASITEAKKAEWDAKYTKPNSGIPASDLAPDVFLQGEKGEQGEQGQKGDDGVGIASVVQTTTSTADGGSNVMTVTLSNGTKSTFTVKNGSKGSQGATGANGTNGKDGADGATFTPSVDANGNLSWSNDKGLANPPTVNIKGPKGDSGEGGGGASSDGRKEVIYYDSWWPITNMRPNVIYWVEGVDSLTIHSFEAPTPDVDTYDVFTAVISLGIQGDSNVSLTLPDYICWANGEIPDATELDVICELSISRISDGVSSAYLAVLTPFHPAE